MERIEEVIKRLDKVEQKLSNGLSEAVARLEVSSSFTATTLARIEQSISELYDDRFSDVRNKHTVFSGRVFSVALAIVGGSLGAITFLWNVFKAIN